MALSFNATSIRTLKSDVNVSDSESESEVALRQTITGILLHIKQPGNISATEFMNRMKPSKVEMVYHRMFLFADLQCNEIFIIFTAIEDETQSLLRMDKISIGGTTIISEPFITKSQLGGAAIVSTNSCFVSTKSSIPKFPINLQSDAEFRFFSEDFSSSQIHLYGIQLLEVCSGGLCNGQCQLLSEVCVATNCWSILGHFCLPELKRKFTFQSVNFTKLLISSESLKIPLSQINSIALCDAIIETCQNEAFRVNGWQRGADPIITNVKKLNVISVFTSATQESHAEFV